MRKRQFFAFSVGAILIWGCSQQDKKEMPATDVKAESIAIKKKSSFDLEFKSWLKDTLPDLAIWKDKSENGILKKLITVGNDSLSLTVDIDYRSKVNSASNQEIKNMIDLLGEYQETPKSGTISFHYQHYFYPASVEQLRHDYSYEIDSIEVASSEASKLRYGFIRGRLNRKEIVTISKDGKEQTKNIDFIWEGDKLVKKPVSK
ncbi:MAG: hypothetical protein ACJ77K_06365 [Bacteroidia bacterium]